MNELMLEEIQDQPRILAQALVDLRRQARAIHVAAFSRVTLAGSGDSGYAAIALEQLYHEQLDRAVWALPSISASRYPRSGAGDLVVPISVSGEVARTIEVARVGRASGAQTIAIVSNGDSTLARECNHRLVMPKPLTRATPHTRDYTLTLLALAVLCERLADQRFHDLDSWVASIESRVNAALAWAAKIDASPGTCRVWFLGAGPDRGTAAYGALKFWEAGGSLAWWDDLEEFAHGSQLQASPGDDVVVLATGRARSRAEEMVTGLRRMGMRTLLIRDTPVPPAVESALDFILSTPGMDALSPLASCLPIQALAYHFACARRLDVLEPMGGREYGQTFEDVHNEWMRQSRVEVVAG